MTAGGNTPTGRKGWAGGSQVKLEKACVKIEIQICDWEREHSALRSLPLVCGVCVFNLVITDFSDSLRVLVLPPLSLICSGTLPR